MVCAVHWMHRFSLPAAPPASELQHCRPALLPHSHLRRQTSALPAGAGGAAGKDLRAAVVHAAAHFGWPAAWAPRLGQMVAAMGVPWQSWISPPHEHLFRLAIEAGGLGTCLAHPPIGAPLCIRCTLMPPRVCCVRPPQCACLTSPAPVASARLPPARLPCSGTVPLP